MKKILAMVLAMMLVLSMSTAFAATVDPNKDLTKDFTDETTAEIAKLYKTVGEYAKNPEETFSFTAVKFDKATDTGVDYTTAGGDTWAKTEANLPTINTVKYNEGTATEAGFEQKFTVTLPEYPGVGVYYYTFSEVATNNYTGVTYNKTEMTLKVTVVYENGLKNVVAIYAAGKNADKTDVFENTYSVGTVAVTKKVTGNLGDKTKKYDITVSFAAADGTTLKSTIYASTDGGATKAALNGYTWTGSLADAETVKFYNVPVGTEYTVTEADYSSLGYTTTITTEDGNSKTGSIDKVEDDTVTIENNKTDTIDTGISLDNAPYMILMALVVVAGAALIVKRAAANR